MNRSTVIGIAITVAIHLGLAGGVAAFSDWGDDDDETPRRKLLTIEATLAYKSEKPPPKQPQKPRKRPKKKKKPKGVSRDENKKVKPKKEAEEPEEDFAKQFEKLKQQRQSEEDDDDEDWEVDTDPKPTQTGEFDGSKHGFAEVSRGDPYMQTLAGDVYASWELPTLEKGAGAAVGCIRLGAKGDIVDVDLWKPTKNANIDRSVEEALKSLKKKRKPGKSPVPKHLMDATQQWTCFKFSVDAQ